MLCSVFRNPYSLFLFPTCHAVALQQQRISRNEIIVWGSSGRAFSGQHKSLVYNPYGLRSNTLVIPLPFLYIMFKGALVEAEPEHGHTKPPPSAEAHATLMHRHAENETMEHEKDSDN